MQAPRGAARRGDRRRVGTRPGQYVLVHSSPGRRAAGARLVATIVIVEDQADNLKLFTALLTLKGHHVVGLPDGTGLLEALRRERPALVLLDIQLPGRDGFSLLEDLKSAEGDQPWKVVALTAYAMPGDREKTLAAGFDGYISKPIDVRSFSDEIARYLG
ncbi:MAG: hypothetical protein DMD47_03150 [Gemmatimonadetes bacterium]|nr:MAG: hypothetical protein DMD47_03150 [Gemmatimonadota bacterium]